MPRKTSPATPIRILIVEDMPNDAELIIAELERAGFSAATYARAETFEQYMLQIALSPDVILCDYALPRFGAPQALRILQERRVDIPFIIVSGSIGEETAVEAIKTGADDYLLKDRLGRLGSAILQALEEKRLRDAAHRAEEDLRLSEYKYRCMFENLPDAAYLCDASSGRIVDTNACGQRALGLDRTEVLGSRIHQFLPATIAQTLLAAEDLPAEQMPLLLTELVDARGRHSSVQAMATSVALHRRRLVLVFLREPSASFRESHSAG